MKKYFLSFISLLSCINLFAQEVGETVIESSGPNALLIILVIINMAILISIVFMLFRQLNSSEGKEIKGLVQKLNDKMEYNNQSVYTRLNEICLRLNTIESFYRNKAYETGSNKEQPADTSRQNKPLSTDNVFMKKVCYGNYIDYAKGFVVDNITLENTDKCFMITQTGEKTAM